MEDNEITGKKPVTILIRGGGDKVIAEVAQIELDIEHAFGPNAKYKARDVRIKAILRPQNLVVSTDKPETLGEWVKSLHEDVLISVEELVEEAEARATSTEDQEIEQILAEQQPTW